MPSRRSTLGGLAAGLLVGFGSKPVLAHTRTVTLDGAGSHRVTFRFDDNLVVPLKQCGRPSCQFEIGKAAWLPVSLTMDGSDYLLQAINAQLRRQMGSHYKFDADVDVLHENRVAERWLFRGCFFGQVTYISYDGTETVDAKLVYDRAELVGG